MIPHIFSTTDRAARRPGAVRHLSLVLAAAALAFSAPAAPETNNFPEKPIRFILSAPAGGTLDALGRVIAEKMSADWKQPVVVEAKAGAAGMLAASAVAKAPADGYTVLFSLASVLQNTLLRKSAPYRLQELTPVSLVATMPVVLAVKNDNPAKSLAELVQMAKQPQQSVSIASWGNGSTGHIIVEAIRQKSGADLTHVAYKGEAEPLADLVGGRVTAATGSPGFYLNQLKDVRILAVGAPHRLKKLPNVPTFEEAGYPLANVSGWGGFFVPAATPTTVTQKLSKEIQKIVALPDVAERIRALEYEPVGNSGEEFARFLGKDATQWTATVRQGNIVLD
jgi:tripartite-type tricarboxylate transporter receptor subunit TctC